ncbi:MAG: DUF1788 domain-containing protein, partial [Candidatus Eisenbacteria sp.]|nr:DUF1788 domain-containing protein [Candidatus Eisenbacteria bacterium]
AGHKWKSCDITGAFAHWMTGTEYRQVYFEEPETIEMKLRSDFVSFLADLLRTALTDEDVDEGTVVAVHGVASLFGFAKISLILKEVAKDIRGRLVLFFPGEFDNNNYRLLDARDGWNYLAVPITLHNGVFDG